MNQETSKVVALLIAIDEDEKLSLRGCRRDLEAFRCFLRKRFGDTASLTELLNTEATRSGILEGFDRIQRQIQPGDAVIVFYAGHGSQAIPRTTASNLKDDSRIELLCPYDYDRDTNRNAIPDFKLQTLLKQLSKTSRNLTVILDCCHSGSLTRGEASTVLRPRQVWSTTVPSIYNIPDDEQDLWAPSSRDAIPESYVLLAACQKHESSFECRVDGHVRGCFTACLIDLLDAASSSSTYEDLHQRFTYWQHTSKSGSNLPPGQNPVCAGTKRYRLLFQQPADNYVPVSTVTYNCDDSDWIYLENTGNIQGITDGSVLRIEYASGDHPVFVQLSGVEGARSRFPKKDIDEKLLNALLKSPGQVHIFPHIIKRSPLNILYHPHDAFKFPLPLVDPQSSYVMTVPEYFFIASTDASTDGTSSLTLSNPYGHPPRNLPSDRSELERILHSVSNFSYHLTRDIGDLHGGVTLTLVRLEGANTKDSDILRQPEINANRNFDQGRYEIQIGNNSPDNYYFHLFFFDPRTFEIQLVWRSSRIGGYYSDPQQRQERDPCHTITIDSTGVKEFGFFRLFASVKQVPMDIAQSSPWNVSGSEKEDRYRVSRKESVCQPYGASTYKVPHSWKPQTRAFKEEATGNVHHPDAVTYATADEVDDFIRD